MSATRRLGTWIDRIRKPRDVESFVGPGVAMRREGRNIQMASTLTPEEHAHMREELGARVNPMLAAMNADVDALYEILHQYPPECVLGALWFRNAPFGAAGDGPPSDDGNKILAYVDYVATLYLISPGNGQQFVIPPHVIEDIQRRVSKLFIDTTWLHIAQDAARDGERQLPGTLRTVRFQTLQNALYVRYPGHFDHMVESLRGIERSMHVNLVDRLGWSIEDAILVGNAIIAILDSRANERLERGAEALFAMDDAAWPQGTGRLPRLVKRIFPPRYRPWLRKQHYAATAWLMFLMQDVTVLTPAELSAESGVPLDRVTALLSACSETWGSCEPTHYRLPSPTPPLQTKVAVRLADERFLIPVPTSFSWSIRPLIESLLKPSPNNPDSTWWDAYETARSSYLEGRAVELLKQAMPASDGFTRLKYHWEVGGTTVHGELDGLLLMDDIAVLVEAKAGSMSPAGRRGAPDGMTEDLGALVGEAHKQALRAKDFMKSAATVVFDLPDSNQLRVESSHIREFLLVTVALDSLDTFTTMIHRLVDMGVVGDDDLPWAVSVLDLIVIADATEFSAQFVQFLRRRARLNELKMVAAHDELDWFAHYLAEGLYFEQIATAVESEERPTNYNIFGYGETLDAHYLHDERYKGMAPQLPTQPMPDDMRALLRELETSRRPGFVHVSTALLDLGWQAREDFISSMQGAVQRTRDDGRRHDVTMVMEDGNTGLTFMAGVERQPLRDDLLSYCRLKMYQSRCSSWVGIGKLAGSRYYVDEAVVLNVPWEYDEALERMVEELLPPLPEMDLAGAGG